MNRQNYIPFPMVLVVVFFGIVVFLISVSPPKLKKNLSALMPQVNLAQYTLSQAPIIIPEIDNNASGLTYNNNSQTLFLIVNSPEMILELDLSGKTIRKIILNSFSDTEGIIHLGDNDFALIEERERKLSFITIDKTTTQISRNEAQTFNIAKSMSENKGFEGLTYNSLTKQFYIVKEKEPKQLIVLNDPRKTDISHKNNLLWDIEKHDFNMSDLSGVHIDPITGNLLLLSDESKRIVETTLTGEKISQLKLSSLFSASIPQPEGITMDNKGTLYICSEPNQLYIYKKPEYFSQTERLFALSN